MAQTKLNVGYLKTLGANTYDYLRVGTTGNVEFATGVFVINPTTQLITGTSSNTYTLAGPEATNTSILVIIEGLIQIPLIDYFVYGSNLLLTSIPDTSANIEIRYLGQVSNVNVTSSTSTTRSTIYTFARIFS
jgi:hypothetical protein